MKACRRSRGTAPLDEGEWTSRPGHCAAWKERRCPLLGVWAPETVWMFRRREKNISPLSGCEPRTVQRQLGRYGRLLLNCKLINTVSPNTFIYRNILYFYSRSLVLISAEKSNLLASYHGLSLFFRQISNPRLRRDHFLYNPYTSLFILSNCCTP
jgi:hypothetical protein